MRISRLLLLVLLFTLCTAPALAGEDPYQPVPDFNRRQDGVSYAVPKTVTYYSTTCGMDRKCNVYLPADYDQSKSYPLLLLLHGIGGDHKEWMGGVPEIIIGATVVSLATTLPEITVSLLAAAALFQNTASSSFPYFANSS